MLKNNNNIIVITINYNTFHITIFNLRMRINSYRVQTS
jgi:hypothetical protein